MDDFGDIYNPLPASQPGRSAMNKFPPVKTLVSDGARNLTGKL